MSKKELDKVRCQYCGKEYTKSGITNHEKACPENPVNKVEEAEIVDVDLEVEVTAPVEKKQVKNEKLIKVKLADKIECYIGDRYYRFKKGEEVEVPEAVKNVLKRAGLLEAI